MESTTMAGIRFRVIAAGYTVNELEININGIN